MITDSYDDKSQAIITPEKCYGKREVICDVCIIIFSHKLISNILKLFECEKIAEITAVNGRIPIYKLNYKGKEIAFYLTMLFSTGTGTCI